MKEAAKQFPSGDKNNSEKELFEPDKSSPRADSQSSEVYKKKGKGGRERSYEKVRRVIVYRVKMGRYQPDLSKDMRDYYDYWYFAKPSKKKDRKDYERHVKAYNRGQNWIA